MARPLNYSTKIPASQTAERCTALLVEAGADRVTTVYKDKVPAGLSFLLVTPHGLRAFTLPVNVDGAQGRLRQMVREDPPRIGTAALNKLVTRKHATDVAWKVAHDWLKAQLEIIAAGMVSLTEVMLPWLQVEGEKTLWLAYQEHEQAALLAAELPFPDIQGHEPCRPGAPRAMRARACPGDPRFELS